MLSGKELKPSKYNTKVNPVFFFSYSLFHQPITPQDIRKVLAIHLKLRLLQRKKLRDAWEPGWMHINRFSVISGHMGMEDDLEGLPLLLSQAWSEVITPGKVSSIPL